MRQLQATPCYTRLPADPSEVFKKRLDVLIGQALRQGTINKKEADFLTTDDPIVPTFYLLPKPLAVNLSSYIRDSTYLIQILNNFCLPSQTLLVTLDVESLYTSISHDLGLEDIAFHLNKDSMGDRAHNRFLLELLFFILDKNYFVFDRTFYRQSMGTAMGARCAPAYANLFLGWWEELVVYSHVGFKTHCLKWLRYIDDVIFFWTGTEESCRSFISELNQNPYNIKLTFNISCTTVEFLDLSLSLEGQFFRAKRNCTDPSDFLSEARTLTDRFKSRGYPKKVISASYQRARTSTRAELLQRKPRESSRPIGIVTTYNNQWHDVRKILGKNWGILLSEAKLVPHISNTPSLVARRARNLKDRLCHSHFIRPTVRLNRGVRTLGTYPCGDCNVCQHMVARHGISLPIYPFQIVPKKAYFNCKSRNLVYALVCNCPKIYVGQTTQEFRRRLQQHLSNISTANRDRDKGKHITPVAAHFLEVHNGRSMGLRAMALEEVPTNIRGGDVGLRLLRYFLVSFSFTAQLDMDIFIA
ncbi:uncharacterized protein [Dendrobates tinctorius]|uniref:uncharacterized protein n=1 Tax=Dendrobates tinctorius TaxID=92724 RepID=UPI003CC9BE31